MRARQLVVRIVLQIRLEVGTFNVSRIEYKNAANRVDIALATLQVSQAQASIVSINVCFPMTSYERALR